MENQKIEDTIKWHQENCTHDGAMRTEVNGKRWCTACGYVQTDGKTSQEWSEKQKKAFIEIQNRVYTELDLSNQEVAEMHTLKDRNEVFALFQFQTSRWLDEFAWKERHTNKLEVE